MTTYRLTARKGNRRATKTFRADNDGAAMAESIVIVLTKALDDTELWGDGQIELRQGGRLVNGMDEKV